MENSNKPYMNPDEYQEYKVQNQDDDQKERLEELLEKRENQEQKISEFSFVGLINKAAKNLLIGNKEKCSKLNEKLNKKSIKEEIHDTVSHADEVIKDNKSEEEIPKINEKNELITVPTQVLPVLTNNDLLELSEEEKEQGNSRVLKPTSTKGSVFPTILLLAVTFTVGIIAAMFILR